jgi:hypothetical protein
MADPYIKQLDALVEDVAVMNWKRLEDYLTLAG